MKKFILWLFVCVFGLLSFSNAWSFTYTWNVSFPWFSSSNKTILFLSIPYENYDNVLTGLPISVSCTFSDFENLNWDVNFDLWWSALLNTFSVSYFTFYRWTIQNWTFSFSLNQNNVLQYWYLYFMLNWAYENSFSFNWNCTFIWDNIKSENNILCDTNYCVENDLCPVPSNFSQLFINDLEFPWKPLINIWIPDYITWDYSSTETWFDLYVGSGYDVDYINSIIDINSYRPSSEDFTNVFVNWLTLILPYIFIALLILFIWKLIKRVFK